MIAVASPSVSSAAGATVEARRTALGVAFLDWLARDPGADWLEIGCEDGAWTSLILADYAPRSLVAVDADDIKLELAHERLEGQSVRLEQAEPTALPLASSSRDLVIGRLGFGGIEAAATPLVEILRVLRPGGQLAICIWDDADDDDFDGTSSPLQTLAALAHAAGFSEVKTASIPSGPISAWGLVARA